MRLKSECVYYPIVTVCQTLNGREKTMPIYEFYCEQCDDEYPDLCSFEDSKKPHVCPTCGSDTTLLFPLRIGGFNLKGDGYYKNGFSGGTQNDSNKSIGKDKGKIR
jgi:putative FmdB family regulatory protein